MFDSKTTGSGSKEAGNGQGAFSAPSLSLPKGGGAIRGIGEKFSANPVTGTGSMTVPIATSPGRSGFGPQLALTYDSGAGNGPFGCGWSLGSPQITRKTDKGLPRYDDAGESDVFILSGTDDLVPVLEQDAQGKWVREKLQTRTVSNTSACVRNSPWSGIDFSRRPQTNRKRSPSAWASNIFQGIWTTCRRIQTEMESGETKIHPPADRLGQSLSRSPGTVAF
jgi:hypothetical protein